MENQLNIPVRKTNRLAIISLIAGILSFLLYLPSFILVYMLDCYSTFEAGTLCLRLEFISAETPLIFYLIGGLVLGSISWVLGSKGLERIKIGGDVEKGNGIIVIGKVFSILGVLANINSWRFLVPR